MRNMTAVLTVSGGPKRRARRIFKVLDPGAPSSHNELVLQPGTSINLQQLGTSNNIIYIYIYIYIYIHIYTYIYIL